MTDTTTLRNHRPLTTALLFSSTTTRSTTKTLLYIYGRLLYEMITGRRQGGVVLGWMVLAGGMFCLARIVRYLIKFTLIRAANNTGATTNIPLALVFIVTIVCYL